MDEHGDRDALYLKVDVEQIQGETLSSVGALNLSDGTYTHLDFTVWKDGTLTDQSMQNVPSDGIVCKNRYPRPPIAACSSSGSKYARVAGVRVWVRVAGAVCLDFREMLLLS